MRQKFGAGWNKVVIEVTNPNSIPTFSNPEPQVDISTYSYLKEPNLLPYPLRLN